MNDPRLRAGVMLACLIPSCALAASAVDRLDDFQPFSAPADVFEDIATTPHGDGTDPINLLRSSVRVSIDEQDRVTLTSYQVFVLESQGAVDAVSQVAAVYSPWIDQKPVIRARVYTAGEFHSIEAADIVETTPSDGSSLEFNDVKLLRAALPALQAGSIVEQSITTRQHTAAFDEGIVVAVPLGIQSEAERMTVSVESSRLRQMDVDVVGPRDTVAVTEVETGAGTRRKFVATAAGRYLYTFRLEEPEAFSTPTLVVATGQSWNRVARRYHQMVEPVVTAMATSELRRLLGETDGTVQDKLARALNYVNRNVRYLSYDLGQNGLVPDPLSEVIARGYGDCKDQSALLVGMLQAMDVDARIALLSTTGPVSPDHPGMGGFDHAVVYLPGEHLWVDPTVPEASASRLPLANQNRNALIIDPATRKLVRTPTATPDENQIVRRAEYTYADYGPATLVEHRSLSGNVLDTGLGQQEWRQAMKQSFAWFAETLQGRLGEVEFQASADRVDITFHVDDVKQYTANTKGLRRPSDSSAALELVPVVLTPGFEKYYRQLNSDGKLPPYRSLKLDHAYLGFPHRYTYVEVHRAPPGFGWNRVPREIALDSAGASYRRDVEKDGTDLTITTIVEVKGSVSGDALQATRDAYRRFSDSAKQNIVLMSVGEALADDGRDLDALAAFREYVRTDPGNSKHAIRLANYLKSIGLAVPARDMLAETARRHPDDALVTTMLGDLWRVGEFSLESSAPGSDLQRALEYYRQGAKIDPENQKLLWLLGDHVYDHYFADLDETAVWQDGIEALERYVTIGGSGGEQSLGELLLRAGEPRRALEAARETPPSNADSVAYIEVAALALLDGADAAVAKARLGANPDNVLLVAAYQLLDMNEYALARQLLDAANVPQTYQTSVGMVRNSRPDGCRSDDPPLAHVLIDRLSAYVFSSTVEGLLTPDPSTAALTDERSVRTYLDMKRRRANQRGKRAIFYAELCQLQFSQEVEGDFGRLGLRRQGEDRTIYFWNPEGRQPVMLAVQPRGDFFGRMIAHALAKGKRKIASAWARWGVSDFAERPEWRGIEVDLPDGVLTRKDLEFFAALFTMVSGRVNADQLDPEIRNAYRQSLLEVPDFVSGERLDDELWSLRYYLAPAGERLQLARERFEASARTKADWGELLSHYLQAGDAQGLEDALENYVAAFGPQESLVDAYGLNVLLLSERYEALVDRLRELSEAGEAPASMINNGTWLLMVHGAELPAALELADKAALGTSGKYAFQNTYAALLAANGHLQRAYDKVIGYYRKNSATMAPSGAVVIALIAVRAGYPDYARRLFADALEAHPSRDVRLMMDSWIGSPGTEAAP